MSQSGECEVKKKLNCLSFLSKLENNRFSGIEDINFFSFKNRFFTAVQHFGSVF